VSVEDRFADLDYPGRRKPVNRDKKSKPDTDIQIWDAHPTFYEINGVAQEFFLIRHVAKALGYSVAALRVWEKEGLMPRPGHRSPRTKGKPQAYGSFKGRRLWTRQQVEVILRLAKKHKVILNRKPPTRAFAIEVGQEFDKLLAEH
jgi:hypothetical protein